MIKTTNKFYLIMFNSYELTANNERKSIRMML